jgi:hypothetical protein
MLVLLHRREDDQRRAGDVAALYDAFSRMRRPIGGRLVFDDPAKVVAGWM